MLLLEDDNFVLLEDGSNLLFEKYFFEEIGTGGFSIDGNATEVVECCDLLIRDTFSISVKNEHTCTPRSVSSGISAVLSDKGKIVFPNKDTEVNSLISSCFSDINSAISGSDYWCSSSCPVISGTGNASSTDISATVNLNLGATNHENCQDIIYNSHTINVQASGLVYGIRAVTILNNINFSNSDGVPSDGISQLNTAKQWLIDNDVILQLNITSSTSGVAIHTSDEVEFKLELGTSSGNSFFEITIKPLPNNSSVNRYNYYCRRQQGQTGWLIFGASNWEPLSVSSGYLNEYVEFDPIFGSNTYYRNWDNGTNVVSGNKSISSSNITSQYTSHWRNLNIDLGFDNSGSPDVYQAVDDSGGFLEASGSTSVTYSWGSSVTSPHEPFGYYNDDVIAALASALSELKSQLPKRTPYCGGCYSETFSSSETVNSVTVELDLELPFNCPFDYKILYVTIIYEGEHERTFTYYLDYSPDSSNFDISGSIDFRLDCPVRGKGILSIDGTGTNQVIFRENGTGAVSLDGNHDIVERTIGIGILEVSDDSIIVDTHSITGDGIVAIDDDSIDHLLIKETSDGSVSIDGDHTIVERTIGVGILEVSGDPDISDTHSITGNGLIEIDDDSEIIFSHIGMGVIEISGDELVILKTKQKEIIVRADKLQEDHSNFLMAIRCEIVGEDFLIADSEDKTLTHHITSYDDDILTMYFNCDLSSDIDNYFYLYSVEYS